jgi:hypothetical protein
MNTSGAKIVGQWRCNIIIIVANFPEFYCNFRFTRYTLAMSKLQTNETQRLMRCHTEFKEEARTDKNEWNIRIARRLAGSYRARAEQLTLTNFHPMRKGA